MSKKIGVFIGSLRKESYNRMIAKALPALSPASLHLERVEIGELPMYNQDFDEDSPRSYSDFRARVKALDGVLFLTPEYNRSVPAVLKNALDIGSRPYGHSVWNGKPGAVISVSVGAIGGFGANHHLRQTLTYLNVPTMAAPELYIGNVSQLVDASGKITQESTRGILTKFMTSFEKWVATHAS